MQSFLKAKKPTKVAYERLVTTRQKNPFQSQEKWLADCEFESHETIDWKSVYILATNFFLEKEGVKQSDLCTF